ncbi:outer membrane lipoprotein carrier protein LolA [Aliidiomarina shirensis]|uniref:Outer-membrane lipoprotein carrier protein n=1 Tax=Aliidiomarina shirensis TaxID=1048642 RepID=A0A432WX41_9GAMM|nr:outer membrane lipoprotein chaperone LolA [Aliidiomarina shirensis]RUO38297.1 outer membrane lipoprotein carrier protein LolA [Aliidiomarina shirensis]
MYRKLASVMSISVLLSGMVLSSLTSTAYAANDVLQAQLEGMQSLQGTFVQEVYDNDELLQEAAGTFYLERPARLRWVTDEPDASVLVADGETIYFYNPFIEQVTLYTQADAMQANPLLLLLDANANWDNFEVRDITSEQNSDSQTAAMQYWQINDLQAYGSSLVLGFADDQLQQLIVDDGQGQKSIFHLRITAQNEPIDAEQFRFNLAPGIDVDDQRE